MANAMDNTSTPAFSEQIGVLAALLNVKGAILLARQVILREAGPNEELVAAMGVLVLAEDETDRIHTWLDDQAIRNARARVGAAHG